MKHLNLDKFLAMLSTRGNTLITADDLSTLLTAALEDPSPRGVIGPQDWDILQASLAIEGAAEAFNEAASKLDLSVASLEKSISSLTEAIQLSRLALEAFSLDLQASKKQI